MVDGFDPNGRQDKAPMTDATTWIRLRGQWVFSFTVCTVLGLSGASALYYAYARNDRPITWGKAAFYILPNWYLVALAFPLVLWLGRRFPIERSRRLRNIWIHLAASLFFSATIYGLCLCIMWLGEDACKGFLAFALHEIRSFSLSQIRFGMTTYWVILAVGYALDYYRRFQEEKRRALQLQSQLAQSQLQALKMQLHPHFLFNTLHSISALLHQDVEAADQMVDCLGSFLRLTLQNSGVQEVPLKQEMEFLRCYLEIEQIRFQDRLTVRMDIDPQTLDAYVPNLMWQPLVENAIKHGIAQRTVPGGCIEIGAHRKNDTLCLRVKDNGPGLTLDDKNGRLFREGLGLSNTRARLRQLYGSAYCLELVNAADGGLVVLLEIPFKVAPHARTPSTTRRE